MRRLRRRALPRVPLAASMAGALLVGLSLGGCGSSGDAPVDEGDTGTIGDSRVDSTATETGVDASTDSVSEGGSDTGASDTGRDTSVPETSTTSNKNVLSAVTGGLVSESARYRMISTHGQIPGGNVLSSGSYSLRSGFVSIGQ